MSAIPRGTTDSPELLNTLTDTFKVVWGALYHYMPQESDHAKELRALLGSTLVTLAANGISDPRMLRLRALERMAMRG